VLETAFAHATNLTPAECGLVAQAAGITHEQVGLEFVYLNRMLNRRAELGDVF
jgi:hypothetical protein